ncbi:MAG: hypothetical protein H6R02_2082, partial [Burkholderiaceae bacterium]|nr:hypothetical protein [Burkholderiaceae bacterium]
MDALITTSNEPKLRKVAPMQGDTSTQKVEKPSLSIVLEDRKATRA